ncbi:uncharacterized protein LOC124372114 [Homalodisca vitripennis]|uniref:uncharacterized protein LOC124372114 n=1 Tax=Homalodisca vitripennis TaxID=197043 RepID=UPI001EEA50DC|nr:uncharacterized protein LOC124372114 [Homalodisca vitripennis]
MNSDSIESEIDWSRETVMQLIDLYREQPVLWNPMDPDFKNKNLKNYAWNDISREIKASNTEVQAKVKTLLAQFQRELKKKKSGSGADEYKSKWCYFKAMLFLKDKTTARKIKEAGIATDDKEAADETVQEDIAEEGNDTSITTADNTPKTGTDPPRKLTKKRKASIVDEAYQVMKKVSSQLNQPGIEDEFDIFGKNVACQLRKLKNSRDQALAKHRINTILFEMELKQLPMGPEPSRSTSASSYIQSYDPLTSNEIQSSINAASPISAEWAPQHDEYNDAYCDKIIQSIGLSSKSN